MGGSLPPSLVSKISRPLQLPFAGGARSHKARSYNSHADMV